MLTFKEAIAQFYGNYVNISGRASRAAYWWVALYNIIVCAPLNAIALACGQGSAGYWVFMAVYYIFCLANLLPGITLAVRRMHDLGRGGGWIFIALVPIIGWIWYLVLLLTPSQPGPNRFGNPEGE